MIVGTQLGKDLRPLGLCVIQHFPYEDHHRFFLGVVDWSCLVGTWCGTSTATRQAQEVTLEDDAKDHEDHDSAESEAHAWTTAAEPAPILDVAATLIRAAETHGTILPVNGEQ